MPREAIRPSRALARLLRESREALGLTLRDVSARTAADGELIPPSTLARIEQGKTDPGVRRLVRLLRLYEIPAEQAADLVAIAERAPRRTVADPEAQYEEGLRLAKAGDLRSAMSIFFAVREHTPETAQTKLLRQKTLVAMAIAAKNLGQIRIARHIVDQLLVDDIHPSLAVSVLLTASALWLSLGSAEAASAFLLQAETHVAKTPPRDPSRALLEHQRVALLQHAGRLDEALRATDRVVAAYRASGDVENAARAGLFRVALLRSRGECDAALKECRDLRKSALRDRQPQTAAYAAIREGQLLVEAGAFNEAEVSLRQGLGEAVALGNRIAEFLAHHQLWKVAEKLGDRERARLELQAARYYLRFLDQQLEEADEIRSMPAGKKKGGSWSTSRAGSQRPATSSLASFFSSALRSPSRPIHPSPCSTPRLVTSKQLTRRSTTGSTPCATPRPLRRIVTSQPQMLMAGATSTRCSTSVSA